MSEPGQPGPEEKKLDPPSSSPPPQPPPQEEEEEEEKSDSNQNSRREDVDPRATCGVCTRLYRDPKILPCLHSFCADCIRQLSAFCASASGDPAAATTTPRTSVLCPECDTEVDLPPSGADGLTTDHLALDRVFLRTLLADGSSLRCDLCGDDGGGGEAELRCEVCCVNLCEFCSQAHRSEELRLFCEPCDRPVCLECAATFHRDHRCGAARHVVVRHGDRIRALVAGSLRPRLERLEESLMKVEISQDAWPARVEATADKEGFRAVATVIRATLVVLREHTGAVGVSGPGPRRGPQRGADHTRPAAHGGALSQGDRRAMLRHT
ncbi:hypothetical protein CRUP_030746 [Coryphaenoides rupestris]|nr:hypothetical protein CRUP_030746 [Coryphaenoides rupestris]